jgi:hypothetical protein
MLVKVLGEDTASVVSALRKQAIKPSAELRSSLTWHRGMELGQHKRFPVATNTQVYFSDPRCPWQRGTNENTNRLLPRYPPAGTETRLSAARSSAKVNSPRPSRWPLGGASSKKEVRNELTDYVKAAREMKTGPPESTSRNRLQTTPSYCGKEPRW